MEYLLRSDDMLKFAIDMGVQPTGRAIALAAGLTPSVVNWAMAGRPPSNRTMAELTAFFNVPFDDLFDRVASDES